jgi:hypothetical protein
MTSTQFDPNALTAVEQASQVKARERIIRVCADQRGEGWQCGNIAGL